ncbi:VOC family protein [Flavobacteriaceae bacterium]|nr:VOC family protein [Flavobacteriaceae bacterium]MDC1492612.1 VOC family protein [Flavobacteriaceae bacterium]
MNNLSPFHLAIPVDNLSKCRYFYKNVLGCKEGRSSDHWVDFDFFGHQLVIHFNEKSAKELDKNTNLVDGKDVPIPHFGVILEWYEFEALSKKLISQKIKFIIEPYIRFKGLYGEQATMFFKDPSGNALEFKAFKDFDQIFRK